MATTPKQSLRYIQLALLMTTIIWIALFVYGYYRWAIEWRLNGIQVDATVLAKEQQGDDYVITYEFSVNDQPYIQQRHVEADYFAFVDERVPVVYSPIDPQAASIPGQGTGDFDVARLPGTFFNLSFLVHTLPVLLSMNVAVLIVVTLIIKRSSLPVG